MHRRSRIVLRAIAIAITVASSIALADAPATSAANAPTDAQVEALQAQITALQRQIDEIGATTDDATRLHLMEQNWQSMQSYMGDLHDTWGMGYPWMAGRPWSMSGPGIWGGNRTWWSVPEGLTADQYVQRMRERMELMQQDMHEIAQTSDAQERRSLMQQHWQNMYQTMQTLRGMGWMWGGGQMMRPGMMGYVPAPSAAALPDPESNGAKLVATYCTQCHAAPQPTLHTPGAWANVADRMRSHMAQGWQGIKTPAQGEMSEIVAYLKSHALP